MASPVEARTDVRAYNDCVKNKGKDQCVNQLFKVGGSSPEMRDNPVRLFHEYLVPDVLGVVTTVFPVSATPRPVSVNRHGVWERPLVSDDLFTSSVVLISFPHFQKNIADCTYWFLASARKYVMKDSVGIFVIFVSFAARPAGPRGCWGCWGLPRTVSARKE